MNEEVVKMGKGAQLTGILSRGTESNHSPVVIMFNAGLLHHVGPFRLWVTLARELARKNIPSLRFDLYAQGDSGLPADVAVDPDDRAIESLV